MKVSRLVIAVPLLLAGCGVTRDGAIKPSVNDCVAALPVAQSLVGPGAHLQVLRRFSLAQTQAVLKRLGAPALTPADATPAERASLAAEPTNAPDGMAGPRPCVVVFTGSFSAASLRVSPGHAPASAVSGVDDGRFALVVTTTRHPRVLRAVVSVADPLR